MDSFGRPIVRQEDAIRSRIAYLNTIQNDIQEYLKSPNENGEVNYRLKFFPVIHTNAYCQDNLMHSVNIIPAEYAMGYFSLHHGMNDIDDMIHGFVNPVACPIGLFSDAVEQSRILKVPMINQHKILRVTETSPEEFLLKLDSLFFQKRRDTSLLSDKAFHDVHLAVIQRPGQRYVFTARKDCIIVERAIRWCQAQVPRTDKNTHLFMRYTVIPLATLLRLFSELASKECPGINRIPDDAAAGTIIDHHKFMYVEGMSCKWHQKAENENQELCSFNIVRRMMYNVFTYLTKMFITMKVPSHTPYISPPDEDNVEVLPCKPPKPGKVDVSKSDLARKRNEH